MFGYCDACREMVTYTVEIIEGSSEVKGEEFQYTKKIARTTKCDQNIFISEIVDENLATIYKTYRKNQDQLILEEIEEMLEKHQIDALSLANLLEWPEEIVTRYIEGQIPSKEHSDELRELLKTPDYLGELLEKNNNTTH